MTNWDARFMGLAHYIAGWSTCLRRQVGCVIIYDKIILSTGYNGAPSGCKHCSEIGCMRQQNNVLSGTQRELCRGAHAEMNAIIQAGRWQVKGATLYTTNYPCSDCAKAIINAGIAVVVYDEGYDDELSKELLKEARITIYAITDLVEEE